MTTRTLECRGVLAKALDQLGDSRGGRVACIVLFTSEHVEFIWPGGMSSEEILLVELVILRALESGLAN